MLAFLYPRAARAALTGPAFAARLAHLAQPAQTRNVTTATRIIDVSPTIKTEHTGAVASSSIAESSLPFSTANAGKSIGPAGIGSSRPPPGGGTTLAISSSPSAGDPLRATLHYFDTFHIVTRLEASGFEHGAAVAMMNSMRALLVNGTEVCKAELLSRAQLENGSYLFRAAMAELRNEVVQMRKAASQTLRLDAMAIQRMLDALDQQMHEDVRAMRTEVEMDVEMRKAQSRAEAKDVELRIQELDNKFTVRLGDLRTATEKYKWEVTRRLLAGIILAAAAGYYIITRPRKSNNGTGGLSAHTPDAITTTSAATATQSNSDSSHESGGYYLNGLSRNDFVLDQASATTSSPRPRGGNPFISLG
ncbi:hypothetical protein PYCC9005_002162 [Savitreella phatthalungensis]